MARHEGISWRPDTAGKLWPYARVSYHDAAGKLRYIERKGRNLAHAKELRHKLLAELGESGPEAIEADKLTFAELAERFERDKLIEPQYAGATRIAGMRSYQRQKGFLKPLVAHFGPRLFKKITYEDLLAYRKLRFDSITRRGAARSVSGVNRELSLLRSIFNYARRSGLISKSPFEQGAGLISLADEHRRDRVLSHEEEIRLLAACEGRRGHLYYIVIAALDTGMRKGELLQLHWSDVDFDNDVIVVRSTTTKTRRGRLIGLTPRLKTALQQWRELSKSDVIFGGIQEVKKSFASACRIAGIEDLHFHDLRHTATTRMVEAGIAPAAIMKATGHTQFATFARYVNPDARSAQKSAELLHAHNEREKPVEIHEEGCELVFSEDSPHR